MTGGSSVGYQIVAVRYALLGVAFTAYGFRRQQQLEAAMLDGRFVPFARRAAPLFAVAGIGLGTATVAVVIA